MRKKFGEFSKTAGEAQLRPIFFPSMTTMDTWTNDRRFLESSGGTSLSLPRTIFGQLAKSVGHMGAVPIGSLQEVTMNDDGNVTGRGWLADLEHVRDTFVPLLASKTLIHNSVDLAEVKIRWGSDDWFDDAFWDAIFEEWAIGGTTLVGTPAFSDAHASLDDFDDELVASFLADPEPIELTFASTKLWVPGLDTEDEELVAHAGTILMSYDSFHMPEPDRPTQHTVTADGKVYGHVANWNVRHGARNRFCPRPGNYDRFHTGTTLTEKGLVPTGPIFFLGGHPDGKPLGRGDAHKAYGGVENTWASVRVVNGKHGPWYCGEVLPGLSDRAIVLARATPISGHWNNDDDLKAIVSCNVRGFDIPDSKLSYGVDGAVTGSDGRVLELVASLHVEEDDLPKVTAMKTHVFTWTPPPTAGTPATVTLCEPEMSEADLLQLAYDLDEPECEVAFQQ